MEKAAIGKWLERHLSDYEEKDIFLIDLDWKPTSKKLIVYVDSETELSLNRCQKISRFIERCLDESELLGTTYNLSVSSPGLQRPLISIRQYPKNIGRILRIIPQEGAELIGKLIAVDENELRLKPEVKKGKHQKPSYGEERVIDFKSIKETFVEIRF